MSRDFKQLQVWRKSHELVMEVYRRTRAFPKEEVYGLTSQIRRAAVSVPSNRAEGCGRGGQRELGRFAEIAHGSCSELAYQILLATDLGYLDAPVEEALVAQNDEISRMLGALKRRVRS